MHHNFNSNFLPFFPPQLANMKGLLLHKPHQNNSFEHFVGEINFSIKKRRTRRNQKTPCGYQFALLGNQAIFITIWVSLFAVCDHENHYTIQDIKRKISFREMLWLMCKIQRVNFLLLKVGFCNVEGKTYMQSLLPHLMLNIVKHLAWVNLDITTSQVYPHSYLLEVMDKQGEPAGSYINLHTSELEFIKPLQHNS